MTPQQTRWRRIRRWSFNLVAVLSALLCMTAIPLWIDSEQASSSIFKLWMRRDAGAGHERAGLWVISYSGSLTIARVDVNIATRMSDATSREWQDYPAEISIHQPLVMLGGGEFTPVPRDEACIGYGFPGLRILKQVATTDVYGGGILGDSRAFICRADYWLVALLGVVLPTWRLIAWWRMRRRFTLGKCLACGYDLRGSPGPACPECGAERVGAATDAKAGA